MKEVSTRNDNLPADNRVSEWEGLGGEEARQDDFIMPFVQIAQKMSPQVDHEDSAYMEDLKPGMFFNTATGEIYGEEITVIPTKFERKWLEFKVREEGGGLVAIHDEYDEAARCTRDDMNRSINDEGNQIVDTRSFYCLVKSNEGFEPAIVSMKSTQGKKARQWMTLMSREKWETSDGRKFTAPLFSNTYNLSTVKEENAKGSWHGYVIAKGDSMLPEDGDERFEAAHAFYKLLVDGGVKVDYAAAEEGATPAKEDDGDLVMQD